MKRKTNGMAVVDVRMVSKTYTSNMHSYAALKAVDITASKGELALVLGPSGSGKTTLLTIIAGFAAPTSGEIHLFGRNITHYTPRELQRVRAKRIGFIFQAFLLIDALTVYENVALVLRFAGVNHGSATSRAMDALASVDLAQLADKRPRELSHGEKQRVAIARAFANDADLLIADEPTASLESQQAEGIIRLLHSWASEKNKCVIVASHDLRLKRLADTIHVIENGRIRTEEPAS